MAREMKKAETSNTTYNNKVDVWSLGLTFGELLTGKLHKIEYRDKREQPMPQKEGVREDLINICSLMIRKKKSTRPFIDQLLAKDIFQKELRKLEPLLPPDQLLFTKDTRPMVVDFGQQIDRQEMIEQDKKRAEEVKIEEEKVRLEKERIKKEEAEKKEAEEEFRRRQEAD